MKNFIKIRNLILVLFIQLVVFSNCRKDSDRMSDPIIKSVVYKTKGNYFNYVNTWSTVSAPATLSLRDSNRIVIVGEDTIYKHRWRLEDDYVLALAVWYDDYFTNITFSEIVSFNEKYHELDLFPMDSIFERVIDTDPFVAFYHDENNTFYKRDSNDIQQINQIIKDDEIEKYFKKLK